MWHLWAHIGSDGRTILGPELRADAIAYGFAELRADAVAYVFADPRADGAPELRADESPDLGADELADGSSIARSDVAPYTYTNAATDTQTDVFAQSTADAGALAPALARADGCPVEQTNTEAYALANGETRRSHGGARIFADAAAFFAAEFEADFEADTSADAGTVGPAHTATDAPPDTESLSGAVE